MTFPEAVLFALCVGLDAIEIRGCAYCPPRMDHILGQAETVGMTVGNNTGRGLVYRGAFDLRARSKIHQSRLCDVPAIEFSSIGPATYLTQFRGIYSSETVGNVTDAQHVAANDFN